MYTNGQDLASIVGLFDFYLPPVLYELSSVNQSKKNLFLALFCVLCLFLLEIDVGYRSLNDLDPDQAESL